MTKTLHGLVVAIVLLPIALYRRVFSPMKGMPSCRYLPTCSEYATEAVKARGVIVGSTLAVGRLLRCNPLFHAGYDPVPHKHGRARAHSAGLPREPRHCGEQH